MVELCPELKDCIVDIGNGIRLIKNKFLTTVYIRSGNDEDLYNKPYRVRRELAQNTSRKKILIHSYLYTNVLLDWKPW